MTTGCQAKILYHLSFLDFCFLFHRAQKKYDTYEDGSDYVIPGNNSHRKDQILIARLKMDI